MSDTDDVRDEVLLDFIGEIYDCAIDQERWPDVLGRLTSLLDGHDATLTLNDISNPSVTMRAQYNLNPDFERSMLEHYSSNPLLPNIWYVNLDEPFSLLTQLNENEVRATAWHKNTMGRFGYRDAAIAVLAKSATRFGAVSVQRKDDRLPFSMAELALFRKLVPHIRRAALIGDVLQAKSISNEMLASTLDKLSVCVMLTDETGKLVHANEPAKQVLEEGRSVWLNGNNLSARHAKAHKELTEAISSAGSGTTVDLPRTGIVVALTEHDKPGLAAWVLPLDSGLRRDLAASFSAKVAIFIKRVGDAGPIPAELFVRRYGITPSECRVMMLLVQGHSPQEAADALGVSIATVKTHLARLLQKTGSKRQADLVRLAMTALAPVGAT